MSVVGILGFVLVLFAGRAFSFPENLREGYPSCTSCHVSPGGGGVLTPYGRGASETFMSTWAKEGEGKFLYGLVPLPDYLMLGGDARGVWAPKFIPMQQELEMAVYSPASPALTLDVSAGRYDETRGLQYRRYYLKAMLSDIVGLRAGRFIPVYGINTPDHTTVTRQGLGFGEGQETYNLEGAAIGSFGELVVTGIFGQRAGTELDSTKVGTLRTDDMVGGSARGAFYLNGGSSVGLSGMSLWNFYGAKRDSGGVFTQLSLSRHLVLLSEADRLWERGQKPVNLAFTKLTAEVFSGFLPFLMGEAEGPLYNGRMGLDWQPRPHLQATLEWRTKKGLIGQLHYWL